MFFTAATEPGTPDTPNEDWIGISPTVAVVLDGVTIFKGVKTGCAHGTPWYVNQLGARLLAAASDHEASLKSALRKAINSVADLHADICDLSQIGAPSAAVAVMRQGEQFIEYIVLADVTILVESTNGLTIITDDRVAGTVNDLAGKYNADAEVMKRRERYRNQSGGYWVAAADPEAAEHATTGQVPLNGFTGAALMSDGVTRLVSPFEQTDWPGLLALARNIGPAALIERVRRIEADDIERTRWPRFKVSDDATIALITP
jgi:hypothetical protein